VLDNNKVKYVKAVMYRTVSNNFKPGERFDYDMLVFFTPAGIKSYITNFPDYKDRKVVIAAMGQTTLEAAAAAGLQVDVTITPETPSMASAIAHYLKKAKAEDEKVAAKAARQAAKIEKERAAAAAKRSAAAKKAAATRKAKLEEEKAAEAAAAKKRSEAAKKAAATRKAKVEAEKKAAAKKAPAKKAAAKKTSPAKKAVAKKK
jgi:hypothetical protein